MLIKKKKGKKVLPLKDAGKAGKYVRKGTKQTLDKDVMLAMYMAGHSMNSIAKKMGCCHKNVSAQIKPYIQLLHNMPEYEKFLPNLLKLKASLFLAELTPQKISKLGAAQLTRPIAELIEKARLLEGLTSANIDVHMTLCTSIDAIEAEIQALQGTTLSNVVSLTDSEGLLTTDKPGVLDTSHTRTEDILNID